MTSREQKQPRLKLSHPGSPYHEAAYTATATTASARSTPPPAMATDSFRTLYQRCCEFLDVKDTSQSLIRELLHYCQQTTAVYEKEITTLREDLRNAKLDLEDTIKSRRDLQQQVRTHDAQYGQLLRENEDLKNRNPYVAILIDGDGLLFKESFIQQGLEGGKKAAYALRAAIAKEYGGDESSGIEIVAKVCANLSGLSGALRRDGSLDSDRSLREFTQGFSQSKASFDFIDVGYGKERADTKIKEAARWHLNNVNCKLVVLGISHDAGYAPFLDELLSVDDRRSRVQILEGSPTVRELAATNVGIMNFTDNIFRSEKLIDRGAASGPPPGFQSSPPGFQSSPPASNGASPALAQATLAHGGFTSSTSNNNTNGKSNGSGRGSPPGSTTSTVGRASPPPTMMLPVQTVKSLMKMGKAAQTAKRQQSWVPGPRGIDPPVVPNSEVMEKVKNREQRLCNQMFLRGFCKQGSKCAFRHDYAPSVEEKKALEYFSRTQPCANLQYCQFDGCIYGHNCPSVRDGWCMQLHCRFNRELHPPDTKFRPTYKGGDKPAAQYID